MQRRFCKPGGEPVSEFALDSSAIVGYFVAVRITMRRPQPGPPLSCSLGSMNGTWTLKTIREQKAMLAERDYSIISEFARKYRLKAVVLFGSSLKDQNANDIDLGIKGIEPRLFFDFYWDVYSRLSKPVDIINLDKGNSFTELVEKEGQLIYGSTRR